MHASDGVLQASLLDKGCEVLEHTGDIIHLEAEEYLNAVFVFFLEGTDIATVALVVGDGESVLKGQRTMASEAQSGEPMRHGELHHLAWRGLSVAVAAMGMIVDFHKR